MINDIISSFNAGELSPYMEARTSIDKYRSGCKKLENYLITPYGSANRRSGTEYLGAAKSSSTRCRLFGLNLSDSNRIVMEIGVGYIRFWQNGVLMTYPSSQTWNGVTYTTGAALEAVGLTYASTNTVPVYAASSGSVGTPVPYQEADLRGINLIQINNIVYLTHPSYPPMRVSYWGVNSYNPPFTVGEVPWKWAPMLDQNYTATTVTPSATSGNITVTSSAFTTFLTGASSHTGAYWEIDHPNGTNYLSQSLLTNTTSSTIQILGAWNLQTFGIWTSNLALQYSTDNVNWSTLRTFYSNNDYNASTTGTTSILTYFRFVTTSSSTTGASVAPRAMLQAIDPVVKGLVKITNVTTPATLVIATNSTTTVTTTSTTNLLVGMGVSGTNIPSGAAISSITNSTTFVLTVAATGTGSGITASFANYASATVIGSLASTNSTPIWREGAFSAVQGYPNACTMHESRLVFAGTSLLPATIWGSYSNDFQNFKQGAYDADSYLFTLSAASGGLIQWLLPKTLLIIGTTQGEWSLGSADGTRPLTPTNVVAKRHSNYGSAGGMASIVNDTILYIQRMARKVRELIYDYSSETWVSADLTSLAEHITRPTIVETAFQRSPDAILWMVRSDGQLVSLTYEREQQVCGSSRQITSGTVESVATIGSTTGEDEVWLLVNRTINGSTVRYVERFKTGMRLALDTADKSSWWYVDAGKTFTSATATTTVTGLSHLNGQTVSVWGGVTTNGTTTYGVVNPVINTTVSGGSITLQTPVNYALVGIPYTSTLIPEMLQRDLQDGTSAGRRMRIAKMNVKVFNSVAGEYSTDGINWFGLPSRHTTDVMDASPPAFFGFERVSLSSNWKDGVDLYFRQSLPIPLTIAAIVASWESAESGQ